MHFSLLYHSRRGGQVGEAAVHWVHCCSTHHILLGRSQACPLLRDGPDSAPPAHMPAPTHDLDMRGGDGPLDRPLRPSGLLPTQGKHDKHVH